MRLEGVGGGPLHFLGQFIDLLEFCLCLFFFFFFFPFFSGDIGSLRF